MGLARGTIASMNRRAFYIQKPHKPLCYQCLGRANPHPYCFHYPNRRESIRVCCRTPGELCEVVLKARQTGVLQLQQQKIAKDRSRSSLGCRNISEFQAQVAAAMVPNQLS
jgi:hypothetical protein